MPEKGWKFQHHRPLRIGCSPPSLTGGRQHRVLANPPHLRLNRMRRLFPALVIVITLGCGDSSGPRVKPASIEIVQAPGGPFYAGLPLPVEPAFVVKDQNGNPIAGVALSISVSAGGGTVTNAPAKSATPTTPIGIWTLGKAPGVNSLKISVSGLAP